MSSEAKVSGSVLDFLLAGIGGIVVPILDYYVAPDPHGYLVYATAACDRTCLLFGLIVVSELSPFPPISSLFALYGIWQGLTPCLPMWRHIRELETDSEYFMAMQRIQGRLILYFGPTVAILVAKFLWSIRYYILIAIISLFAAMQTFSFELRTRLTEKLLLIVTNLVKIPSRYGLDTQNLFLHVCEGLIAPLNRWEVAIARRRRDRKHSSKSLSPYRYRPLKNQCIRLLRLKRKSFFSEPSCELVEVPLRTAPSFEAVSYAWGDKPPHIPLKVNGCQLLVTSAVEELLFHQRSILGSELFWIDAICINQSDNNEKNQQLRLMTNIYRSASRVIVWLGASETRKDTHAIRKMIRALDFPESCVSTSVLLLHIFEREEQGFIAMAKLLNHPWFERIWVTQEVAVGKKVHVLYHGTCIDWDVLAAATSRLCHDGELRRCLDYYTSPEVASMNSSIRSSEKDVNINVVEHLRWTQLASMTTFRTSKQAGIGLPLSVVLVMGGYFKSKDPRDEVFAVLGIAEDGRKLPFKPDYNEDVEKVFLKTTAFVLSTQTWFTLFSATGRGYAPFYRSSRSQFSDKMPSWVHDYSSHGWIGFRSARSASMELADPDGKIIFTDDEKIIKIQAVTFDEIQNIGPIADIRARIDHLQKESTQKEQNKDSTVSFVWNWYDNCKKMIHESPTMAHKSWETLDQEFWELCMCQNEYKGLGQEPTAFSVLSPTTRNLFERFLNTPAEEVMKDEQKEMLMYLERRFSFSTSSKAFCITAAGAMALVPPLAKNGDTLVHVRGGYVPIVLRKKTREVRRAELVGSCTVQYVEDVYSGTEWEDWLLE